jgi:hypothetical protein
MLTGFWLGNPKETNHFKDIGLHVRIILKLILKTRDGGGGVDWIHIPLNMDKCRGM